MPKLPCQFDPGLPEPGLVVPFLAANRKVLEYALPIGPLNGFEYFCTLFVYIT
jgi:hypothetical protein